eukprot:7043916-Pyramimonas_sp.AAC.1
MRLDQFMPGLGFRIAAGSALNRLLGAFRLPPAHASATRANDHAWEMDKSCLRSAAWRGIL